MAEESVVSVMRQAVRGDLPDRYVAPPTELWRYWFDAHARERIKPGMTVLDIGAGRKPAVPAEVRPAGVTYVGLDIDAQELAQAPEGAYDETIVGDACSFHAQLADRFDLVLSLFLLEHVPSVGAALENAHRYLKPGGQLVAQLAGRKSVHGRVNRAIPHSLGRRVAYRSMRSSSYRAEDSVFPAVYDACTASDLERLLAGWSEAEVTAQHTGAQYFLWSRFATALYLGYEERTYRRRRHDLATWYLVLARK